jgi:hypothetical protein
VPLCKFISQPLTTVTWLGKSAYPTSGLNRSNFNSVASWLRFICCNSTSVNRPQRDRPKLHCPSQTRQVHTPEKLRLVLTNLTHTVLYAISVESVKHANKSNLEGGSSLTHPWCLGLASVTELSARQNRAKKWGRGKGRRRRAAALRVLQWRAAGKAPSSIHTKARTGRQYS